MNKTCDNCKYELQTCYFEIGECDGDNNKWEPDTVSNPPHYTTGGIECIDAIRSALTPEEFRGYCKGNVLKYIWRNEDIKKAIVYAGWIK